MQKIITVSQREMGKDFKVYLENITEIRLDDWQVTKNVKEDVRDDVYGSF